MTTEDIISFETAKLAKEKGFDSNNEIYHFEDIKILGIFPTQSLLQKWLREKHDIHIVIKPFFDFKLNKITYAADIIQIGNYIAKNKRLVVQETYELALDIAEQASLKLIP